MSEIWTSNAALYERMLFLSFYLILYFHLYLKKQWQARVRWGGHPRVRELDEQCRFILRPDVGSWNRGADALREHTRLASVLVNHLVAILRQLSKANKTLVYLLRISKRKSLVWSV